MGSFIIPTRQIFWKYFEEFSGFSFSGSQGEWKKKGACSSVLNSFCMAFSIQSVFFFNLFFCSFFFLVMQTCWFVFISFTVLLLTIEYLKVINYFFSFLPTILSYSIKNRNCWIYFFYIRVIGEVVSGRYGIAKIKLYFSSYL